MKKSDTLSYRDDILMYAAEQYGTEPEYLWMKYPEYAVLRHADNKKWYAILMNVEREKLGLSGEGAVDILDIKCEPIMGASLLFEKGFLPAYHMNKGNWITVLLDGTVDKETIFSLLTLSFDMTSNRKAERSGGRSGVTEWLVPANPKYYDVEKAFAESDTILWKQSNSIAVGDIVYLYMAAPISAIRYKCKAVEVGIPCDYNDGTLTMTRMMKIRLLHRFEDGELNLETLREYGVHAVRGPRGVPNRLHYKIQELCTE